jgi:hypothetical protein
MANNLTVVFFGRLVCVRREISKGDGMMMMMMMMMMQLYTA